MDNVCIALINPDDPYPIAFVRTKKAHDSFKRAWEQSHKNVERLHPEDWDYDDVKKEMRRFGFNTIKCEYVWGE